MINKFFLLTVLVLPTLSQSNIPLKLLYEIVQHFPVVSFCERTLESGYWMEAGNVRHITYTGKIKPGETGRELCNCMHKHMTQKDWLTGAVIRCISKCGYLTYHVSGKPDPTYDPNAPPEIDMDRPLEKLRIVFSNTPKTNPLDLNCTAKCTEGSDIIHCWLTCPLRSNETRSKDEICVEVNGYYDQMGWLEGATIECNENDGVLEVEFIGSA